MNSYRKMLTKCNNIGLWTINRPRELTCIHATEFCRNHCYNNKLERIFHNKIHSKDTQNEINWQTLTGEILKDLLTHIKTVKRLRLMSRGEAFTTLHDVRKVEDFCIKNPDWLFWVPTRAWRDGFLRLSIELILMRLPNLRLFGSIDPSNSIEEMQSLIKSGWSTAFFGSEEFYLKGMIPCPKTHFKKSNKVKCSNCNICFSSERVDVHYKEH